MRYNTGESPEELKAKYNPEGSELRKMQLRMLDMLLYIDAVCKEQRIDYRLDAGNILGAVRHGGFIPWDDDVDISLLPKEYKRLVRYLKDHPHPQYVLQDNDTDPGFYAPNWAVLRDLKSEYKQNTFLHNARKYKGAQIDIFCYDNHLNKTLFKIAGKISAANIKWFIGRYPKIAYFIYKIQECIINPLFHIIGYPFSSDKVYGLAYGHLASNFNLKWLPEDFILPHKPIEFEGHVFQGPAKPAEFLTTKYGDYMKLTPEEKRCHHHAEYKIWD